MSFRFTFDKHDPLPNGKYSRPSNYDSPIMALVVSATLVRWLLREVEGGLKKDIEGNETSSCTRQWFVARCQTRMFRSLMDHRQDQRVIHCASNCLLEAVLLIFTPTSIPWRYSKNETERAGVFPQGSLFQLIAHGLCSHPCDATTRSMARKRNLPVSLICGSGGRIGCPRSIAMRCLLNYCVSKPSLRLLRMPQTLRIEDCGSIKDPSLTTFQ